MGKERTMASEWEDVALEDVADEITVGYVGSMASEYVDRGVTFLRSQNIEPLRINKKDLKFITPEFHQRIRKSRLTPGDVVIVRTGKPGSCSVVPPWFADGNCSDLVIVRCGERINNHFLAYYINTAATHHVSSHLVGAVQQHFNVGAARTLRINLPPLSEQKRIAHILGTLDDKIELNRRMNATLEAMARALFQSWFVDFDPVKRNAEGPASRPEDSIFSDSFETSLLGDIPSGWNATTLGDVLDVLETGRRPKGGVAGYSSGIPSIGAESIWGIGKFDYSKTKYVPTEFYEKTSAGRVEHNDVLLYKDGGKPGEFRPRVGLFGHGFPFEKFCINEHVFRMRSGSVGQIFLYFTISDQRVLDDFANKGGKAAIPGINQVDVRSTRIIMPDKRVLEEFNRQVTPWCDLMIQNAIQSRTLANLRDTLLPKLLSGEITTTAIPELSHA
jgi:type I restriction enzyme S subunit